MIRKLILVGTLLGGTACLAAQQTLDEIVNLETLHPRLKPFRTPDRNIEPPKELFAVLRRMHTLAKNSTGSRVGFDAEGREVCDNPEWQQALVVCKEKIEKQAGYLLAILEESKSGEDREIAAYGAFYVEDPNDTFGLLARFPSEPLRPLRESAYARALEFVKAQWKKNLDKPGPDGELLPQFSLNLIPYAALLKCKDSSDQAQGLWFLRECLLVRPQYAKNCFEIVAPLLPPLLVAEDATLRREARAFLRSIDKHERAPKTETPSDAEVQAWLFAVAHDVLPPIRRVSAGRWDLYPSKDRQELVRVGRDSLATDAIGVMVNAKAKSGDFYRGYQLLRLPAPLDRLPFPIESVITSINGSPVSGSKQLLEVIELLVTRNKVDRLIVEYVQQAERKVIEVRIVSG